MLWQTELGFRKGQPQHQGRKRNEEKLWGAQEDLNDYALMMWTQTCQGPLCLRPTDVAEPSPGEAHDGKASLHTRVQMLTVCTGNACLSFLPFTTWRLFCLQRWLPYWDWPNLPPCWLYLITLFLFSTICNDPKPLSSCMQRTPGASRMFWLLHLRAQTM